MTTYCAETDLERLLSAYGVEAFADHDESGTADTGVVDDCISQASDELTMALYGRYAAADLATSDLVTRWATTYAAYFLCMRRGNPIPESLQMEFERIGELVAKVASGAMQLPGVALRCDPRPTWSNLRVDRRWPRSKTRVKRVNSSDAPTKLSQDRDEELPIYDR